MKIAVNPYVINKPSKDATMEFTYLAYNFQNKELSQAEAAHFINEGRAITAWHGGGPGCNFDSATHDQDAIAKHKCPKGHRGQHRLNENFIAAQHLGLDFDKVLDVDAIFSDPFISDYYGIWYYTASSTQENPRFRILFELENEVTDGDLYREMVLALLWKVGGQADKWCKDPCRIFYGSKDSQPVFTGNVLPARALNDLVEEYRAYQTTLNTVQETAVKEAQAGFVFDFSKPTGKEKYLKKVLDGQCERVRSAQKGNRHHTLRAVATLLGGYIQGEGLDETEVRQRLEEAYSGHNPDRREMRETINYGISQGKSKPLYIPDLQPRRGDAKSKIDPKTGEVTGGETGGKEKKKSQATILVELAEGDYFHDDARRAFVTLEINGHNETWPVRSRDFKLILNHRFYKNFEGVPGAQAVEDALRQLEARAIFDNPCLPTFYRIGSDGPDTIYLDLANDDWQAVKITADGWEIVDSPPVKFRRAKGMLPIPAPVTGGKLNELTKFINIEKDDLILVIAWLIGSVKPTGPYPGLALNGEQGSAKSGMSRVLKMLLDPASAAIRATPKDEHDMVIAASNSWIVAYDNLSYVQPWQSDCLCRLATGGGLSTRELYSDDQEAIFDVCRPVILNGIEALATRSDLLDRYIVLELPTIPETQRKTEREIMTGFEKARPKILGALLDRVSIALKNQGETKLEKLPRMADFALWAYAALGDSADKFIEAYTRKQNDNSDQALDSSILAKLVIELAEGERKNTLDGFWQSTPSELLEELSRRLELDKGEKARQWVKTWPQDATRLSGALKRITPNLRKTGIEITFDRYHDKDKKRFIKVQLIDQPKDDSADAGGR